MRFVIIVLLCFQVSAFEFKSVEHLALHPKMVLAPYTTCSKMLKKNSFVWTSEYKKSQRSVKRMEIFGAEVIESIIHFDKEKVSKIELIYFNKTDSGKISVSQFNDLRLAIGKDLQKKLGVRVKVQKDDSKNSIYQWLKGRNKYRLEVIDNNESKRSLEYIRLVVESVKAKRVKFYTHEELQARVKKTKDGDVYIGNMPMVDQGQKGYCVCASLARVLQHFGRDVDQHEIARMANSGKFGTSYGAIKSTLNELAPKVYVKNRKIGDFVLGILNGDSQKKYESTINKEYRTGRYSEGNKGTVKLIRAVMDKYAVDFRTNERAIYNAVDLGRPIAWALVVGLVPEEGVREGNLGGHMRLVIGYNKAKKEIIYTDTWGKGHEIKRMNVQDAMVATFAMWELRPSL